MKAMKSLCSAVLLLSVLASCANTGGHHSAHAGDGASSGSSVQGYGQIVGGVDHSWSK